jgi:transcriptional regulator with GAF, ATPase, and Fis domain
VQPIKHDLESIAATLRIAQPNEDLRPRPAALAIEILDGPDAGVHTVGGEEITVGRGALCNITLTDASVSEFHFKLTAGTEDVLLEDLGSSNGLWIGRAKVERARLLPGARFRAGAVRLQLREIETAPFAVARGDDFFGLRGRSEHMRATFALLSRAAPTPLPVLITGETGVGKGELARAVHRASGRSGRFVTMDCTRLPYEMADGLLFGHIKGAFTGATSDRPSPFEEADGGTLFLDEIGELPLDLQPKLLRAIDEHVVQRLGSNTQRTVDVRIVAATNRHLMKEVSAGRFRVDLYHRLAGIVVRLQPLRNRREDIPFLAALFLAEVCAQTGQSIELGAEVAAELQRRDWPGNVRELRQTVLRAVYLSDGAELAAKDLVQYDDTLDREAAEDVAEAEAGAFARGRLQPLVDEFKRAYCRELLSESPSMTAAARVAGFTPRGFQLMLKKLGMKAEDYLPGR